MDSRDVAPSLTQSNPDANAVPDLLRRAVSGVLRNAQNGDLPLFEFEAQEHTAQVDAQTRQVLEQRFRYSQKDQDEWKSHIRGSRSSGALL